MLQLLLLSLLVPPLPAHSSVKVDATWWWQLDGLVSPGHPVQMIDLETNLYEDEDRRYGKGVDPLVEQYRRNGADVICYFSAGSFEEAKKQRADNHLFPANAIGAKLDGWEERFVDIRRPEVREIMVARMVRAKRRGCTGVEPDNVDAYKNQGGGLGLTLRDEEIYLRYLAEVAHRMLGLKIALKNDPELAPALSGVLDLAIVEECDQLKKEGEKIGSGASCESYAGFLRNGKGVFRAEYMPFDQKICDQAKASHHSLLFFTKGVVLNGEGVVPCR